MEPRGGDNTRCAPCGPRESVQARKAGVGGASGSTSDLWERQTGSRRGGWSDSIAPLLAPQPLLTLTPERGAAEPLTQPRRGKLSPFGPSEGMRRPHSSPNPRAGVGMSRARSSPLRPSRAPFVNRALCLRLTERVCFSSPRSPPPPPFSPGSWNALLTLPFPEALRPCSLPANRAWHTWAGTITKGGHRIPLTPRHVLGLRS